ncbi:MAG: hypothetical protein V7750_05690 [Sneathiella sp.]
MRFFLGLSALFLFLSACAGNEEAVKPNAFFTKYNLQRPTPTAVTYCSSHGCLERETLSLTPAQWQHVTKSMREKASDPVQERVNISLAVAEYEKIAGKKSGTSGDRARTGLNNMNQLDCIDESINTTSLLVMMEEDNLIQWHSLAGTVGRGEAFDWPHFAPSLQETGSQEIFVMDSWFRNNGKPAVVLPLQVWKAGWNPT